MSKGKVGAILVGAFIVVGAFSLVVMTEKVPTGYVGVQYSMNGGVQEDLLTQGWRLVSPTKKVSLYSIATETLYMSADKKEGSKEDESLNIQCKDGSLNADFEMSYAFNSDKVVDLVEKYRGQSGDTIMETKIRGKIRTLVSEVTSQYSVLDVHLEKKAEINKAITEKLQSSLSEFGIVVESASLPRTQPSKEVEEAIIKRTTMSQELEAEKQRQEKIKLEAETKKIQAQGEADAKLIQAKAEADSNKLLEQSITEELIRMKEADARLKHGWVTVNGANTVVTNGN